MIYIEHAKKGMVEKSIFKFKDAKPAKNVRVINIPKQPMAI
jgi:hypothetical protein